MVVGVRWRVGRLEARAVFYEKSLAGGGWDDGGGLHGSCVSGSV